MVDPELADFVVGVRKGKAVRAQRVREAGGVKVRAQLVGFRPRHPVRKVLRFDFITRHRLVGFEINGVQIQALYRDQAQRQLQIRTQFGGVARFARIVTRGLNTPVREPPGFSKPATSSPCQQCMETGRRSSWRSASSTSTPTAAKRCLAAAPGLFKLSGHAQSSLVSRFC